MFYVNEAFKHLKDYENKNQSNRNADFRKEFTLQWQKWHKMPSNKKSLANRRQDENNFDSLTEYDSLRCTNQIDYNQDFQANYFSNQEKDSWKLSKLNICS